MEARELSISDFDNGGKLQDLTLNYFLLIAIIILPFFSLKTRAQAPEKDMVFVKGGNYVPLYGNDSSPVMVADFWIDKYLVSNVQYEKFLQQFPKWSKTNVKRVFADQGYLKHLNPADLNEEQKEELKNSPVTNVSWFAAKAYCECQGKRLPWVDEWEFAAAASEDKANASNDTQFYNRILDWYSRPNPKYYHQ